MSDILGEGKLFVFEGLSDSGKTTLSRAFANLLNSNGTRCEHFSFPGCQPRTLGQHVYEIHHDPFGQGIESIDPTSLQLLHVAAHIDSVESSILPLLASGTSVVLDRYWWSTWVYGLVGKANQRSLRAMIELESIHWRGKCPTVAFLLLRNLPAERSLERDLLGKEYIRLADREKSKYPVRLIDNNATIEKALAKIISNVEFGSSPTKHGKPPDATNNANISDQVAPTPFKVDGPLGFSRLAPAKTSVVYDTYWRFAAERQAIFFSRIDGTPAPWTDDPVLRSYKFTNAYRASDRVSQYLIQHVIYQGDQSHDEVCFRILLFKVFNRIETWELLTSELGTVSFAEYSFDRYEAVLSRAMEKGNRIYSAAYIMPSGGPLSTAGRKHRMHLGLIEQMMRDELPTRIADASSMGRAFELLRSYPTVGDFLAYQYVTDLNYSTLTDFTEMEFVVPGPGAFSGLQKCFTDLGGLTESEIIKFVCDRQQSEFERLGLEFQTLWGRDLQLIDCQNLFCEVDKYARVKHPEFTGAGSRTRIKQKYHANPDAISYWYPPKWGLNEKISSEVSYVSIVRGSER